jgi:hypothetical protein
MPEKNREISRMKDIYQKTSDLVILLGKEANDSNNSCMEL